MMNKPSLAPLDEKIRLFDFHFAAIEHPLKSAVQTLFLTSEYAYRQLESLKALLSYDDCKKAYFRNEYESLISTITLNLDEKKFAHAIRQLRHQQILRLHLRELAGLSDITETMQAWSEFADELIKHTLSFCQRHLASRYGAPKNPEGDKDVLNVLAMGKLGGYELNYSSDIDLIFVYLFDGKTDGTESISNQLFHTKTVQLFIKLFQNITPDGFVFRVDLRLRPNGESGPIVTSISAMETYYQEQGRDWERYAMVKARVIGDKGNWFTRIITPFVYKRYVDFSVIESLRSMKAMIEREVQFSQAIEDIKRGRGGIREIEFIIQCFQLIRGGRIPSLQTTNALAALEIIKKEKLFQNTKPLKEAYLFLRALENVIQIHNDQQTHVINSDAMTQSQIMYAMGYKHWDDFYALLQFHRKMVREQFQFILAQADVYTDEKRLLLHQLECIWHGHVETELAIRLLESIGFHNAARCYQMIYSFRHGGKCTRLSQAARIRLDRFMVLLLHSLQTIEHTDEVLLQVFHLLENIVGRSAYLALLSENPPVLNELLHWFQQSPFITHLIVQQPFLLETLVGDKEVWQPLSKKQLQKQLQARLRFTEDDEGQNEVLRQFKLTCWLMAARAELLGVSNAVYISQFLSDVAEVIIQAVLSIAVHQLSTRFPKIKNVQDAFAIVAYGKLGSREMNYDSDVDLVFLHAVTADEEHLITRLTQKILHIMTIRTQSGVLYPVDTRLRPSGSAGLLVSHMDAFQAYQCTQAWDWEHQAIVRARVICGNQIIESRFIQTKQAVFHKPRDRKQFAKDVKAMRFKIEKHLGGENIKHQPGGLLDLEFLIQYLILAYPNSILIYKTNTLDQLNQLFLKKVITEHAHNTLEKAYYDYHQGLHRQLLQGLEPVETSPKPELIALIAQLFAQ